MCGHGSAPRTSCKRPTAASCIRAADAGAEARGGEAGERWDACWQSSRRCGKRCGRTVSPVMSTARRRDCCNECRRKKGEEKSWELHFEMDDIYNKWNRWVNSDVSKGMRNRSTNVGLFVLNRNGLSLMGMSKINIPRVIEIFIELLGFATKDTHTQLHQKRGSCDITASTFESLSFTVSIARYEYAL